MNSKSEMNIYYQEWCIYLLFFNLVIILKTTFISDAIYIYLFYFYKYTLTIGSTNQLNLQHCCACLKPGPGFLKTICFGLFYEVVVHFVVFVGINYHHRLNFLFIINFLQPGALVAKRLMSYTSDHVFYCGFTDRYPPQILRLVDTLKNWGFPS